MSQFVEKPIRTSPITRWLVIGFLGLMVGEAAAQGCDNSQVAGPDGQCRAPLVLTELLPATEVQAEPLYASATLFAPDGKPVTFSYLQEMDVVTAAYPIPIEELRLPIAASYLPRTQRGYFNGHRAWDLTYRNLDPSVPIEIQVPHPGAILLAAFTDVPLGRVAERIQASGSIEVFYVLVAGGEETAHPYIITYAHLDSESVSEAVVEAGASQGKVTEAGIMGHTGFTDGQHIHLQVLDLLPLYEHFTVDNPIAAYGALVDLTNPLSEELSAEIFIDPSSVLLSLQEL